jgi:hypothetical protein
MKSKLIDSSKAPRPGKKPTTKAADQSRQVIESLVPGKVAQIELAEGENVRGVKVSLTRAARTLGTEVTLWDNDGVIYAELTKD